MKISAEDVVETAHKSLESVAHSCLTSKNRTKLKSYLTLGLVEASSAIEALSVHKRATCKTRKALTSVSNSLSGMLNGIESDAITLSELRVCCKHLIEDSIPNIRAFSTAELENLQSKAQTIPKSDSESESESESEHEHETESPTQKKEFKELTKVLAANSDWHSALTEQWKYVKESLRKTVVPAVSISNTEFFKQTKEQLDDAKVVEFLARIKNEEKRVPTAIKSGYGITHLPVIPMFENPLAVTSKNLSGVGINHSLIAGYPVFENQFILLISKSEIAELAKTKSKKPAIKSTVRTSFNEKLDLQKRPMIDYANSVLEILNSHTSLNMKLVSEKYILNPRNTDIMCFWIMPNAKLNAFARASSKTKLKAWSFPFEFSSDAE